jgi:threonine/homoserine/homoserine lactone efflux protein
MTLFERTMEGRKSRLRFGLICCLAGAAGSVFVVAGAKRVGYLLPSHFLLFDLLSWAYGFCFLFWLLWRLKRQSPGPKQPCP